MSSSNRLLSADEARAIFAAHFEPKPVPEEADTAASLGRVLAEDVTAPEDLPPFRRSLMDGFAVRAADVTAPPALLRIVEEVRMGAPAESRLGPGEAARVPTGGMLPEGADAVVPVELTEASEGAVRVLQPVSAGRHLIERGEDVRAGEVILRAGHRLRSPDVGALMGLGIVRIQVYRRPRVAILSTGDEVVPPEQTPAFGQIRDMNSYGLAAAVEAAGGQPRRSPIAPDEEDDLLAAATAALRENDALILNGGSSVGERDVVAPVINRLGKPGVLAHGVNIRPGKPTIFAVCGGKPVFGLPGQPVSALNTFELFVAPLLRRWQRLPESAAPLRARLAEPLRSADGREDHVRVVLETRDGVLWAIPLPGVSAMISTMVRAQGITVVPAGFPGFEAGEEVEVRLIGG
jgi:molybdopterin molybdotransferase